METSIQTYVNPLSDWGFKRLFGTEMNKDLLLEFLRGLFPERDIRDITYLKSERQNLTEREREILDLYIAGKTVKDIVELTGLKETTVRFHNRNIYTKLGVHSLKQLLRFCTILQQEEGNRGRAKTTE